jgi:hypothetical protein
MIDTSQIVKTYSGRIGCMCGCLGKYNYTQDGADLHGPGYNVQDSVSERGVKIIARRVLSNPNVQYEGNIAFVEDRVKNRIQAIYFKETV